MIERNFLKWVEFVVIVEQYTLGGFVTPGETPQTLIE